MNIAEVKAELERIIVNSCDGRVSWRNAYAALDALEKGHQVALVEKDAEIVDLDESRAYWMLAHGKQVDQLAEKDGEIEQLKKILRFILEESDDCKLCHEACRKGLNI